MILCDFNTKVCVKGVAPFPGDEEATESNREQGVGKALWVPSERTARALR